jgi:hypothetical protein
MKNNLLSKIVPAVIIVVILSFPSCNFPGQEKKLNLNDTIVTCNTISLKIDNSDLKCIGYGEADEGFVISIVSICLRGDFIYMADEIHKNIKKIDLNTSHVTSSPILSKNNHYKFFNDIGFFNNRIYVSTVGDTIFTLNEDLSDISILTLPFNGIYPTYIMDSDDESLTLMTQVIDSTFTLNNRNQVLNSRKSTDKEESRLLYRFNLSKGILKDKDFVFKKLNNKEYLTINDKTVILCEPFRYEYDAINLDFDKNRVVIFNVDPKKFKLFIYVID